MDCGITLTGARSIATLYVMYVAMYVAKSINMQLRLQNFSHKFCHIVW